MCLSQNCAVPNKKPRFLFAILIMRHNGFHRIMDLAHDTSINEKSGHSYTEIILSITSLNVNWKLITYHRWIDFIRNGGEIFNLTEHYFCNGNLIWHGMSFSNGPISEKHKWKDFWYIREMDPPPGYLRCILTMPLTQILLLSRWEIHLTKPRVTGRRCHGGWVLRI